MEPPVGEEAEALMPRPHIIALESAEQGKSGTAPTDQAAGVVDRKVNFYQSYRVALAGYMAAAGDLEDLPMSALEQAALALRASS